MYKLLLGQKHLEAAQVRFMRPPLGLTRWDKQRNVDNRSELNQDNIVDEIKNYQLNWLKHVNRIENSRLPKLALQYQPHGKRDVGRPRRRWRKRDHLKTNGLHRTGLRQP
jgi:hypothetical protein